MLTDIQRAKLEALSKKALPLNDDEHGSARQIKAENAAFTFAESCGIDVSSFETSREGTEGMLERLKLMTTKTHHCSRCFWVGDLGEAADSAQRMPAARGPKTVFGKMCPKCTSPIDPTMPETGGQP